MKRILEDGTPHPGPFLNAITLDNELDQTRYAVIVGKKLARSAATRNRKRRQIYEIIRILEKNKTIASDRKFDIVLMVRSPAMKSNYTELESALKKHLAFLA